MGGTNQYLSLWIYIYIYIYIRVLQAPTKKIIMNGFQPLFFWCRGLVHKTFLWSFVMIGKHVGGALRNFSANIFSDMVLWVKKSNSSESSNLGLILKIILYWTNNWKHVYSENQYLGFYIPLKTLFKNFFRHFEKEAGILNQFNIRQLLNGIWLKIAIQEYHSTFLCNLVKIWNHVGGLCCNFSTNSFLDKDL